MSSIVNGLSGITIGPKTTRGYTVTWENAGWQGITILQPEPTWSTGYDQYPLPPGLPNMTLNYNENGVNYNNAAGIYGFNCSVTNNSEWVITFNIQMSTI
jgi:hypothetical protein